MHIPRHSEPVPFQTGLLVKSRNRKQTVRISPYCLLSPFKWKEEYPGQFTSNSPLCLIYHSYPKIAPNNQTRTYIPSPQRKSSSNRYPHPIAPPSAPWTAPSVLSPFSFEKKPSTAPMAATTRIIINQVGMISFVKCSWLNANFSLKVTFYLY